MKLRAAFCTAVLLVATLVQSATPAAAASCSSSGTKMNADQNAGRRPVVFVHGWTAKGGDMKDAADALYSRTGKRIQPFHFDYGSQSTTWAADKLVGGCLATYITGVGAAFRKVGGDGRVILVGHSMGGLASLYATTDKAAQAAVGGLITFDTPYLGSLFGNTGVAGWLQGVRQAFGDKLVPPAGSDAQICLGTREEGGGKYQQGCDAKIPPYLPNTARVTQIAGDITVTRSFGPFHMYDIPLSSDGIVTVDSQHGYLAMDRKSQWPKAITVGLKEADCSITNDSVLRTAKAAARGGVGGVISGLLSALLELKVDENALDGLLEDRLTPGLVAYLAAATATAGCSHVKILGHSGALDHATAALKEYLDWLEPGTQVQRLRPVTANGTVAAGWSVVDEGGGGDIDCSFNSASPAAEKGDIYYCSPTAERADACWVGEGRDSMLCLRDPMTRQVVRMWLEGTAGFGPTGPAEYSGTPAPIRLDLDNGATCRLRNGGSWGSQEQNPDLVGFYGCDDDRVVWAGQSSKTGIDQNGKTWTVRVGLEAGGLSTRKVRTAYYVAMAG
jgi:pimeloyl-ACP methyl ester carboxylesterase